MSWFKRKTKWWIGFLILSLLLASTSVAWAGEPDPGTGGARRRPVLRGEVTAIDGTTLSVKTPRGEVTVLTDEHTRFFVPGVEAPGLKDFEPGTRVAIIGVRDEADNLIARLIRAVPERQWALVRGEVTAVEAEGFSLNTRRGELTVRVDDGTCYCFPGLEEPGLNDLAVGDQVLVGGMRDEDGNLLAKVVGRMPERPRRGRLVGRISAIEEGTIMLTTRNPSAGLRTASEVTVLTDEHTRFRLPGVEDPGVDDLEIGEIIGAAGRWTEDGDLQALIIGARRGQPAPPPGESQLP